MSWRGWRLRMWRGWHKRHIRRPWRNGGILVRDRQRCRHDNQKAVLAAGEAPKTKDRGTAGHTLQQTGLAAGGSTFFVGICETTMVLWPQNPDERCYSCSGGGDSRRPKSG